MPDGECCLRVSFRFTYGTNNSVTKLEVLGVSFLCLLQIIVPVLVDNVWCSYMFNMHGAELYVMDPLYDVKRLEAHKLIHKLLHDAFRSCLEYFF